MECNAAREMSRNFLDLTLSQNPLYARYMEVRFSPLRWIEFSGARAAPMRVELPPANGVFGHSNVSHTLQRD